MDMIKCIVHPTSFFSSQSSSKNLSSLLVSNEESSCSFDMKFTFEGNIIVSLSNLCKKLESHKIFPIQGDTLYVELGQFQLRLRVWEEIVGKPFHIVWGNVEFSSITKSNNKFRHQFFYFACEKLWAWFHRWRSKVNWGFHRSRRL